MHLTAICLDDLIQESELEQQSNWGKRPSEWISACVGNESGDGGLWMLVETQVASIAWHGMAWHDFASLSLTAQASSTEPEPQPSSASSRLHWLTVDARQLEDDGDDTFA